MSKAKTNALDALRALIAERQQYEQWISTLEAKREGTPEHVFERVHNDYRGRLERVALRDSAIQRCFRDMNAGTQHASVSTNILRLCASDLLDLAEGRVWTGGALIEP